MGTVEIREGKTLLIQSISLVAVLLLAGSLFAQTAEEPVGWRTDGSGKYSDASPSVHWTDMHNLVWSSPMPAEGNATPILIKDRIFLCAEPDTVAAVDCFTGNILWQKVNDYPNLLGESEWEATQGRLEEKQQDIQQYNALAGQLGQLKMQAVVQPNAKVNDKIADLSAQLAALKSQIGDDLQYAKPPAHGALGNTSPTPVSDGKNVYVLFGTGIVVCYDIDGNRKWIKMIQRPSSPHGLTASPTMSDGKLIVHIDDVIALDPTSGKEIWRAESEARFGSPVAAKVGGKPVIFTASGSAIDAKTGEVLHAGLGDTMFNTPIVSENMLFYIDSKAAAYELPTGGSETEPEELWSIDLPKDRYCASPVYHRGVVYAITQAGLLTSIEARSGRILDQQKLPVGGRVSPSVSLGGRWLYVGDESGKMIVLDPSGDAPQIVTENLLEPHRASPVFSRDRMYLRGLRTLHCIGGDWAPPAPGETRISPAF